MAQIAAARPSFPRRRSLVGEAHAVKPSAIRFTAANQIFRTDFGFPEDAAALRSRFPYPAAQLAMTHERRHDCLLETSVRHVHIHPGGSTPCKTNCPCTSAGGVERGQGTAALAGQRRCRTAAAGCTAGCPRAPRRVNTNAFKHGHYTAEAIATRREIAKLLRDARALVKQVS